MQVIHTFDSWKKWPGIQRRGWQCISVSASDYELQFLFVGSIPEVRLDKTFSFQLARLAYSVL